MCPLCFFRRKFYLFLKTKHTNMNSNSRRKSDYKDIPMKLIVLNTFNPRKNFDPKYIKELAKSLKRDGQWDSIIVRKKNDGKYELIAGECRLKAAKLAGLKSLKARILESDDNEALLLALKTNILRQDLNPVEEANALKELINIKKDLKDVIKALGKSRTWFLNRLKLTDATEGLKNAVLKEELPLLSVIKIAELPEGIQGPVASKAIRERLNVNEVKKLVELFKKASNDSEVEFLLQTPVKDYMRSAPYQGKRVSISRCGERKPTMMKCECGTLYIVDWVGGRIIGEKVMNHEHNYDFENNSKIFK